MPYLFHRILAPISILVLLLVIVNVKRALQQNEWLHFVCSLSFSLLRFFGGLFFKPNNVSFGILSNLRHPCPRPLGFQIKAPLDYLIFMFLSVLLSLTLSLQSSAHKFFLLCVLHSQAVTDLRLLHFPDPCYLLAFPLRLFSNFRTILLLALTISL